MRKTYQLLTFTLLLASQTVYGESYFRFRYVTEYKTNLIQILNSFTVKNINFKNESASIVKTRKQNPHVENWNYIDENIQIDVYLEKNIADKAKLAKYIKEKDRAKVIVQRTTFNQYIFSYSISQSSYQQKNQAKTFSRQYDVTSPYILGLSFNHFFKAKPYRLGLSLEYAGLSPSHTDQSDELTLDPEWNFGTSFQYDDYKNNNSYSFGFDYEKLNSINLDSLQLANTLIIDANNSAYLTIGFSKSFELSTFPLFFKLNLSKSLSSQKTTAGIENPNGIAGWKSLIYLSTPIAGKWTFHLFQKYYQFTGGEDFKILRYGAGVGYVF